jgi:hypothetical protein
MRENQSTAAPKAFGVAGAKNAEKTAGERLRLEGAEQSSCQAKADCEHLYDANGVTLEK